MNKEKRILKANLRAKPWILFWIWLLLILSPALFFLLFGENFIEIQNNFHLLECKESLTTELSAFRQDLSHNQYLDSKLEKFLREKMSEEKNKEGWHIEKLLEKELGIKPLVFMSYSSKTDKPYLNISKKHKDKINYIPNFVVKEILKFEGIETQLSQGVQVKESSNYRRAKSYFEKVFKLMGSLDINPKESASYLSGIAGFNRVLIYYAPIEKLEDNEADERGCDGFLIIVREADIGSKELANFALGRRLHGHIVRDIVRNNEKKLPINSLLKGEREFELNKEEGKLSLLGFPSQQFIQKLATGGSFHPEKIEKIVDNWHMLQVSILDEDLVSPIMKVYNSSKLPLLILFLTASILLLRLEYFGLGSSISLSVLLALSIVFAALIPFSVFGAAIVYHQGHKNTREKIEINLACKTAMEQLQQSILGFVGNKESKTPHIGEDIKGKDLKGIVNYFKENIRNINARAIIYTTKDYRYSVIYNKGNNEEVLVYNEDNEVVDKNLNRLAKQPFMGRNEVDNRLDDIEREILNYLLQALNNMLASQKMEEIIDLKTVSAPFFTSMGTYSTIFDALSRLNTLNDGPSDRIFTVVPSFSYSKEDQFHIRLNSLSFLFFNIKQILQEYMAINPTALGFSDSDYSYEVCLIPLRRTDEKPSETSYLCKKEFDKNSIKDLVANTTLTMSSSTIQSKDSVVMSSFLRRLNSIIILKTKKISKPRKLEEQNHLFGALAYFSLVLLVILLFFWRAFIMPIRLLIEGAEEVNKENYETKVTITAKDEFGDLGAAFNEMTKGLQLKELMSSYVGTDVLNEIRKTEEQLEPGGEKLNVSIAFCSIEGFSKARTKLESKEFSDLLDSFIDLVDEVSTSHEGQIDKLIGDTIMIVYREKDGINSMHTHNCCKAALEIQEKFSQLSHEDLRLVFGIATGEVISGKIGSYTGKLDFTVIGNSANLASRLKGKTKNAEETGIILCPQTIRALKGAAIVKFIKRAKIKGRTRRYPIYELLGLREK